MELNTYTKYIDTPIGWLKLIASQDALLEIQFVDDKGESDVEEINIISQTMIQLEEYFQGNRKEFALKLAPHGTDFQQKIWQLVKAVPFGETASYLHVAKQSGSEKNTRAVGLANGNNPIPIIIPCHRIIGTNGKLTGYAGGLERKRWLLHHELSNSAKPNLLF